MRFPWIWLTFDFFPDGKECKEKLVFGRRWPRETLNGLSAPNAYLESISLCRANLNNANLQGANLIKANLQGANLRGATLWQAKKLTPKQIKSSCFWDEAIYKGEWHWKEKSETWVPKNEQAQQDNDNYIDELKKDTASDPKEKPDCSRWSK